MKKLQVIIICFLIASSITNYASASSIPTMPQFYDQKRFIYLVAWNGIPVGQIIAQAGAIKKYKGRDVYVMTIVTKSNKFLSMIYRVEDIYTSYVDTQTMTSRRYEADRKEGHYRRHVVVEYDFENMEAISKCFTDGFVGTSPIEANVQDPVSAICYFMRLPVELNKEINMTVNLNDKNYQLFGKVEDAGKIRLSRLGSFPAFKIRPYAKLKGKRVKKGKAWMYFSRDAKRYPLYGVVLIPFGSITATLKKVEDM